MILIGRVSEEDEEEEEEGGAMVLVSALNLDTVLLQLE